MVNRFFIVIYFLLHIGIFIIPIAIFGNYKGINLKEYQVRCTQNNKLVVLQGTIDGSPHIISEVYFNSPNFDKKELIFYCNQYDAIQYHVEAYKNAKTVLEEISANKAYFAFHDEAIKSIRYIENYTLEPVNTDNKDDLLHNAITTTLIYTFLYYIFIQSVRIIYLYISLGKIIVHPYKLKIDN